MCLGTRVDSRGRKQIGNGTKDKEMKKAKRVKMVKFTPEGIQEFDNPLCWL